MSGSESFDKVAAARTTDSEPSIGAGLRWAFSKFGQNLVVLFAFAAIVTVIHFFGYAARDAVAPKVADLDACSNLSGQAYVDCFRQATSSPSPTLFAGLGLLAIGLTVVFWVLATLATIGLINASLKLTRGEKPQFSDLWTPRHFWQYVFVALFYGATAGFGLLLGVIPGLMAIWAWQFAQYSALDSGPGIVASFGESWRLVKAHKGPAVFTLLIVFTANIVVVVTLGFGALVAAPIMTLFMAHMYRQFRNEPVAA
jgi:hypothetical protein